MFGKESAPVKYACYKEYSYFYLTKYELTLLLCFQDATLHEEGRGILYFKWLKYQGHNLQVS